MHWQRVREVVQSLQGTVHRADYGAEHCGDRAVGIHEARHVGSARVTMVLPFRQGCVLLLDSPLYALQLESQCRPEQVWQKTVVPAPTLSLVGPPQGAHRCDGAVFADIERTLEAHAQLVHVPTGVTLPDTALRGGLRRIASRDDAVVTSRGMRSVRFTELAIEHKPSSCARKRATGAEQQRLQENCYTLAFTLLCPATGRVLGAIRQPGAITLRNSFHTLSETEKAFAAHSTSRTAEGRRSSFLNQTRLLRKQRWGRFHCRYLWTLLATNTSAHAQLLST